VRKIKERKRSSVTHELFGFTWPTKYLLQGLVHKVSGTVISFIASSTFGINVASTCSPMAKVPAFAPFAQWLDQFFLNGIANHKLAILALANTLSPACPRLIQRKKASAEE